MRSGDSKISKIGREGTNIPYFGFICKLFFCTKIVYHYKRKGKNYLNEVLLQGLYCEQIAN